MLLKIHKRDWKGLTRTVVAICDKELIGKKYESNGLVLDLMASRRFYEGEVATEEQVMEALKGAENVNLVGEKSIKAAGKVLKVTLRDARKIGGVPHVQVYELK